MTLGVPCIATAAAGDIEQDLRGWREAYETQSSHLRDGFDAASDVDQIACRYAASYAHTAYRAWEQGVLSDQQLISALDEVLRTMPREHANRLRPLFHRTEFFLRKGLWTEAAASLAEPRELIERVEVSVGESLVGNMAVFLPAQRGRFFLRLGLFDQAWRALEDAERAAQELRAPTHDESGRLRLRSDARFYIHSLRSLLWLALEEPQRCIAATEAALGDGAIPSADHRKLRSTLLLAASMLEVEGGDVGFDVDEALRGYASDPTMPRLERAYATMTLARRALLAQDLDSAEGILEVLRGEDLPLGVIERARVAALEVDLAIAAGRGLEQAAERWEDARGGFISSWARVPPLQSGLGYLNFHGRQSFIGAGVRLTLARGGSVEEALQVLLEAQSLSSLSQSLGATLPQLDEIRAELLVDGEVCVMFLTELHRGIALAIDAEQIAVEELPGRLAYEELVLDLARAADMDPRALDTEPMAVRTRLFAEAGSALGAALLRGEVRQMIARSDRISVVGADFIPRLSVELLRIDGQPLGLTHAISYLPSLPAALALARRPHAERDVDVALVCDAQPSDTALAPLPFDDRVRAAVLGAWQPDRVAVLSKAQATRSAVTMGPFGRARVGQVLVHGTEDLRRVQPTGLLMTPEGAGDDGVLWPADLDGASAPDLVLATACGTWRSPRRIGDGGTGFLAEAFLAAGARAVGVSAGDIAFAPTVRFSRMVHEALARGFSPADAYLSARRALAEDEFLHDPYFSSRLVLVGLGHRPLVEPGPRWPISGGVVIATLLTAGLVARHFRRRGAAAR